MGLISTVHELRSKEKLAEPRFKPWAAGWEAWTLPLCYAALHRNITKPNIPKPWKWGHPRTTLFESYEGRVGANQYIGQHGWVIMDGKALFFFFSPLLFLRPLLLRFKWKLSAIAFQCSLLLELQLVGGWPLHSHCGCSTFYYNYFSYSFLSCCVHSFQAFFFHFFFWSN